MRYRSAQELDRDPSSELFVIAFGQQPCGFFPRRFLVAKIRTARRLQAEIGGRIVFFFHDSDHDPRETRTILRHRDALVRGASRLAAVMGMAPLVVGLDWRF